MLDKINLNASPVVVCVSSFRAEESGWVNSSMKHGYPLCPLPLSALYYSLALFYFPESR